MKDIAIADVRNFALLGHTGSGKTTLLDAMLFKLGVTSSQGSPENKTSSADYSDEEKEREISIWAKSFDLVYTTKAGRRIEIVAMDTPGYADFYGQAVTASRVADGGIIVIDAASGVQVGSTRAWGRYESLGLPRAIVITGIDKENVDFHSMVASLQKKWGKKCVPVVIPTSDHSAVVDVLAETNVPEDIAEQVTELKGSLVEYAAETDDALIEKYLGGESLTAEEIAAGLHGAVHSGNLVPIFAVSGKQCIGVEELLEGISLLMPSPIDHGAQDVDSKDLDVGPEAPFSGLVWRTIHDPFAGKLSFIRVYSGTLSSGSEIFNSTRGEKEKISHIFVVNGESQEEIKIAHSGDIVAIPKLKHTELNDSLCAVGQHVKFRPIQFPNPVTSYAVRPKKKGEEDKLAAALAWVVDEDPTVQVNRNNETKEMILSGMGDAQIDLHVHRMKEHNHVDVDLETPKVPYKETVTSNGEGHHKHKKQSGGRGQYGEVYLRVEPKPSADEEWFVNAIVGGAIPSGFISAVEKGLVEGLSAGAIARYPVTGVKITLYDGSYHDVDSSEIAFKIAGAKAFREGMSNAQPVLLEPIMKVKIMVPDDCMGNINGDLNHKRGRILGMANESGMQVIEADVPQAEMFKYSSELRSMTSGRGSFELEFSRYEQVPQQIAEKVIATSVKDGDEE